MWIKSYIRPDFISYGIKCKNTIAVKRMEIIFKARTAGTMTHFANEVQVTYPVIWLTRNHIQ